MNEYLQTSIVGCAWCNKIIRINTVVTEDNSNYFVLSHGICEKCKRKMFLDNELEEESEEFLNI